MVGKDEGGLKAAADQAVQDAVAQEMELRRNEVESIAAHGNSAVLVPVGGAADAVGLAAGIRSDRKNRWGAEQQRPQPQQFEGQPKWPTK